MIALTHARIVSPPGGGAPLENATLLVDGPRIVEIRPDTRVPADLPPGAAVTEAQGLTVLPGFLDVHIHGGGGADTMDATPDALRALCRTHARHGTTGLLATTMTQSRERITRAIANARHAWESGADFCPDGARVLGIHVEGPYISPERPGAQPVAFVRDYDEAEFAGWREAANGAMKLMTVAPERPGAEALFAAARAVGIVLTLGHTDADAVETARALDWGATHATHLFNAMPSIHHRKPGPIPVLLTDRRVRVEVIADGHHVAPEVVRMILAAKGADRVILVTDAMAGAGAGEGIYDLGGSRVTVRNGRATLDDGTLAGSVLTMDRAAANVRAWAGLDWNAVARITSTNAADEMGWTHKGRLAPGADADFVLVDDDLTVHATYVAGRCVYRR